MFERSRRKIIAAIMAILVVILLGTLCVIYAFSYHEVSRRDGEMLARYAEHYVLPSSDEGVLPDEAGTPPAGGEHAPAETEHAPVGGGGAPGDQQPPENGDSPAFRLSVFYAVALAADGEALAVDCHDGAVYGEEELVALATDVVAKGDATGVKDDLRYLVRAKDGYTLVAFIDNTIVNNSTATLLRYTLIFGSIVILIFFFPAAVIARRVVAPLEESYEKQKRFISDAGHELKTPIAVVSANAELLAKDVGNNPWLENIRYENERMGALVGQLLELARTEQVAAKAEHVDVSRLVVGEALPFESVAYEKGVVLRSEVAENIHLKGDADRLRQLVAILLDNALRHGKSGGTIDLTLQKSGSTAVLTVANEGDPIPEATRNAIFERFYRVDAARGDDGHYGLGLAIAKAIVDSHKGKISLVCEGGKVIFRAELPLTK